MKKVKVKIYWLVKEKRIPPVLDVKDRKIYRAYCPSIRFENQEKKGNDWSSVISLITLYMEEKELLNCHI